MINTCILLSPELKLEKKIKIRVEPGIFEWTKWEAGKTTPTLMSLEELKEANFNIDTDYRYAVRKFSATGAFPVLIKENFHDTVKVVRKALFKRDCCSWVLQQGREVGLNSEYKEKWGVIATEQGGSWWMENS